MISHILNYWWNYKNERMCSVLERGWRGRALVLYGITVCIMVRGWENTGLTLGSQCAGNQVKLSRHNDHSSHDSSVLSLYILDPAKILKQFWANEWFRRHPGSRTELEAILRKSRWGSLHFSDPIKPRSHRTDWPTYPGECILHACKSSIQPLSTKLCFLNCHLRVGSGVISM